MPVLFCVLLDIMVFFILIMLLRSQFNSYLNYASFFVGVWILIIAISRLGLYDTYVPSYLTYALMYITLLVFVFVTYFLRYFKHKKNLVLKKIHPSRTYDLSRINYVTLIIFSLITSAILAMYLPEALSILATGGFSSVRHNVLYSEDSTYSSASLVFLKWAINPLILAEFMISVSALVLKRVKHRRFLVILLLILSLANLAMYTLIFAGRWLLMEAIIFVALLLIYKYGAHVWKLITQNKTITLIGILSIVAILNISGDRSLGNTGIFTSVYVYFAGAVDMLDVLVTNPTYAQFDDVLFGAYTLDGLLSPFYVIFNRIFGTDIPFAITEINAVTSNMVSISPTIRMNNNCTYVYGVLRDFGVVGIFVGPAILAITCHVIYSYFEKNKNDYGLILYLYMIVVLFFMVIEWMFGRVNVIYTAIYLYLIMRFCYKRKPLRKKCIPPVL